MQGLLGKDAHKLACLLMSCHKALQKPTSDFMTMAL